MLKNPTGMKEILCRKNSQPFLTKFLLLHYEMSTGYYQRALVDESGMIKNQMGMHNRSEMFAVPGTPCVILPHTSMSM
jgi:hypothetical protein